MTVSKGKERFASPGAEDSHLFQITAEGDSVTVSAEILDNGSLRHNQELRHNWCHQDTVPLGQAPRDISRQQPTIIFAPGRAHYTVLVWVINNILANLLTFRHIKYAFFFFFKQKTAYEMPK